jgi:hypothetical protein
MIYGRKDGRDESGRMKKEFWKDDYTIFTSWIWAKPPENNYKLNMLFSNFQAICILK